MAEEKWGEADRRKEERRNADREDALIKIIEDNSKTKTWWQGNQTQIWRVFVLVFLTLMSFMSAWIFNNVDRTKTEVAALTGKFATKDELKCAVDRIEFTINRGFDNFDRKLEDTNKFLRDNSIHK